MNPVSRGRTSVGVIGAGLSGLVAAQELTKQGFCVTVFDKSRGVGGRMATRRADHETSFDHGAQYFTARDPIFVTQVDHWLKKGVVATWPDASKQQRFVVLKDGLIQRESRSVPRYVGTPAMNSVCKALSVGLEIKKQTRVTRVVHAADQFELLDDVGDSLDKFDRVIVATPAEQAADLLVDFPKIKKQIEKVEMSPCWAAMVTLDAPLTDQWVGAFLHDSFLSWTARNNTKPGRNSTYEQVIVHATPEWTDTHWESPGEEVTQAMLQEFWRVTGIQPRHPIALQGHRWKYAIANEPLLDRCLKGEHDRILVCGDWVGGSRVEGAFLSGWATAEQISHS
ncbi:MAG: FAD-dependent oxidoreductase [Pirellulaceae bacterium]|nr:FAD-dependent oxidoreductase [Pirellulaceae bacterium]